MTSSRSPVSGRSDASWCGRGLRGPSSFTGRPLDLVGEGGGSGSLETSLHCRSVFQQTGSYFL